MTPAFLLMLLLSADPRGGAGTTDCWKACQRHVQEPSLRAKVCRLCIIQGGTQQWVLALGEVKPVPQSALSSALTDEDWRIRWAAVRASAKARGVPEPKALAEWVTGTPASADLPACLTAARAAAESGSAPAAFLQGAGDKGAAAATRVQARKDAIREALEVELYAEDAGTRVRALSHLATFLQVPPARAVLDAMEGRPESADPVVAGAMLDFAERNETSVGRMLLDAAQQPDKQRVDRLFALYVEQLRALQPELTSSEPLKRGGAVRRLRLYGPLAQRELETALKDPDTHVRQSAARGLAQAEGNTLLRAVGLRLQKRYETGMEVELLRPWLEALAHEKTCQSALLAVAEDSRQPVSVRGEVLALLPECDGNTQERAQRVGPFLKEAQPPLRAGAVRALGGPWSGEVSEVLKPALEDPAPEVVVAALDVAALKRKTGLADDVAGLLGSENAEVRQASARALERLGKERHVKVLSECLLKDAVPAVRVAAAQALGQLGGPFAISALSQAATKDPDSHVQHVSRETLKRLGFSNR